MNYLTTNLQGRSTRIEEHQGREYLISPVVMITEGVFNGSNGPLYYPVEELSKSPAEWDGKPVTLYHPAGPDGRGISAASPGVIERMGVGMVRGTKWEKGKLRAEAWLDVEKLRALAPELIDPLLNDGGTLEVSTGLFTDPVFEPGWYGGKNFDYVARNHRPDHLALLPNQVGACSIRDGCGLGVFNQYNGPHHKEHKTMNTYQPLFAHHGPPVMNHGGGDRDDFLAMPIMDFNNPAEPTTNGNCGCGGHGNRRETEADIDRDFNRRVAVAGSVSLTHNGTRETLPLPTMNFGSPASHGGKPTANHGGDAHVVHHGPGNGLPLPRMVF